MNKALKALGVLTTFVMLVVLIGGALVTKTGSGLGCGRQWPLCHGRFFPELNAASIIEWSHRLASGVSIVLVLSLAFGHGEKSRLFSVKQPFSPLCPLSFYFTGASRRISGCFRIKCARYGASFRHIADFFRFCSDFDAAHI